MKQILPALGRFLLISLTSFGMATFANSSTHQSYWQGTIQRVQTTDFNMLSHTLPTKLSYTLIKGDFEELQRTLDSNYGLFGMVVTDCKTVESDCPDQKILYSSNSQREWKKQLSLETLSNAPYSTLKNPPPIITESGFADARDQTWKATGIINSGEIVGRVYYVRGIPQTFWVEYQKWLENLPGSLFGDSGTQKYYSLTISLFGVSGLVAFYYIERLLYRKRLQKRQAQKEREQLLKELERLRQQLRERLRQMSSLIAQREQFVNELAAYQQQESQATEQLVQMTAHLESQLVQKKQIAQPESTKVLETTFFTLREENQQNKQTITALQQQIAQAQQAQNQDENAEVVEALKRELEAVERRNQAVEHQGRDYKRLINNLRAEVAHNEQEQRETEKLVTSLRTQFEDAKRREQDSDLRRQEMEETVAKLKDKEDQDARDLQLLEERIAKLREEEESDDALNEFERSVLGCLESSLKCQTGRWRVHDQFDVSDKKGFRRVTDFIVVGQSCVFVIEAKYYLGKILAEGDARNIPWICQPITGTSYLVKSSGGNNPYKQVLGYTDSMRGRIERGRATGKVGVYGIVVFPEGADVSRIQSEIGGYYEITTLERLVQVIESIERDFVSYSPNQVSLLSVEQLDDLICKRPVKKLPLSSS